MAGRWVSAPGRNNNLKYFFESKEIPCRRYSENATGGGGDTDSRPYAHYRRGRGSLPRPREAARRSFWLPTRARRTGQFRTPSSRRPLQKGPNASLAFRGGASGPDVRVLSCPHPALKRRAEPPATLRSRVLPPGRLGALKPGPPLLKKRGRTLSGVVRAADKSEGRRLEL